MIYKGEYYNLLNIPDNLTSDIDFAELAVVHMGIAFKFFSKEIRDNKYIAQKAIKTYPHTYIYASARLRDDYDIALMAVTEHGTMLSSLPQKFKNCKEIVFAAIMDCPHALVSASESLRSDKDFLMTVLHKDPYIIYYYAHLKNDVDFAISAISLNRNVLQILSPYLTSKIDETSHDILFELKYLRDFSKRNKIENMKKDIFFLYT